MALAWTLVSGDCSTCLFGASKLEQVQENLKAVQLAMQWSEGIERKIEAVLGNEPSPEMEYRG